MAKEAPTPKRAGLKAPAFSLADRNGETHSLKSIEEDYVVLFFYPKDNTPGCTLEAKAFNSAKTKLKRRGAIAIGISGGDESSKEKFCKKHKLSLPLVSDSDFKISTKYGVYGPKQFMGRTFDGIHRTTFVIGPDRKIVDVISKAKPAEHLDQALALIDGHKKN